MDLTVKFLEANAKVTIDKKGNKSVDWKPAVVKVGKELKKLNPEIQVKEETVEEPIAIENMIGDVMTPPNEFGYSTIRMEKVKRIVVTEEFLKGLTGCQLIIGDTEESKVIDINKDGKEITEIIRGGKISGTE